jgi:hypothetical protein
MLYTDADAAVIRKVAILQTSLTFVSIAFFLVILAVYVHMGSH